MCTQRSLTQCFTDREETTLECRFGNIKSDLSLPKTFQNNEIKLFKTIHCNRYETGPRPACLRSNLMENTEESRRVSLRSLSLVGDLLKLIASHGLSSKRLALRRVRRGELAAWKTRVDHSCLLGLARLLRKVWTRCLSVEARWKGLTHTRTKLYECEVSLAYLQGNIVSWFGKLAFFIFY